MSLCCFPTLRGSGPKKARSERRSGCCALWRKRHRQRLSPSATRHPQVTQGSPGRAHPGQARPHLGSHLASPAPSTPSSCVCVGAGAGVGKGGRRGTHPGQELAVRGWKPGGSVTFTARDMAGGMERGEPGNRLLHPLVHLQPSRCPLVPSLAGGLCRCPSEPQLGRICGGLLTPPAATPGQPTEASWPGTGLCVCSAPRRTS